MTLVRQVEVERLRPPEYESLDECLYEATHCYGRDFSQERLDWIFDAVRLHLETCEPYRNLAIALGFSLEDSERHQRLDQIPLLSSGSFKQELFGRGDDRVKRCTSSGTMGTKSIVPRDARTLERFAGSVLNGAREFLDHHESQVAYILGPPRGEAGDLWFSYSLGLTEVFHEARYFVHDGRFEPGRLHEELRDRNPGQEPVIASPPSLLLEYCDWVDAREEDPLDLSGANAWVVTAGGWKRTAGTIDRKEFESRVKACLKVPGSRIRDVFNMVELNSAVFECEAGAKHVPPWLEVIARDPADLSGLPSGESGILSYLDPTPISFPGFILSDDVGYVSQDCACGRRGKTMFPQRRLKVVEERGCGRKMDRYAQGEGK